MTLNEIFKGLFILEQEENIVDILKRDCAEYIQILHQTNMQPLYRGMKTMPAMENGMGVISPRVDRRPLDTSKIIHGVLNKRFTEKFGYPFRNAIFATCGSVAASEYGTSYVIFPIGELHFLWSDVVEDLYSDYFDYFDDDELTDIKRINEAIDEFIGYYQTTDLAAAMFSGHEVMIANKCYALTVGQYMQIKNQL